MGGIVVMCEQVDEGAGNDDPPTLQSTRQFIVG